ncbi:inner-membrane translocator [Halobacillus mangrovi]|uniref:Inner-membrane translocator n=1 Tax=Halobacillus mangrovi TaxID=402384 RepID=A0A1W5ZX27_9BACI|nr:inner-membrane translocator [Halobacillus mangrovi]ARI77852.1 inner-membrane translocator [Halobacillus mangrovi]
MAYDVLMWLFLAALIIPANIYAINWHRRGNFPLWASGLLLAIFGVGLGFAVGGFLIGPGNSGQGGAIMAAFVGLVTVGNGLIHFFIGLIFTIGKLFTKKNT